MDRRINPLPFAALAVAAVIALSAFVAKRVPGERDAAPASPAAGHAGGHSTEAPGHGMGTRGLEALRPLAGEPFDVAFLSQMIAHHEAAVRMAQEALGTAALPETKNEAQKVIDAQTGEIARMTGWLKDWYGASPDPRQQALVREDMAAMSSVPIDSDRAFFEMMIPHHQGAIDLSLLAEEKSPRAEVKQLAREIVSAQESEIEAYRRQLAAL